MDKETFCKSIDGDDTNLYHLDVVANSAAMFRSLSRDTGEVEAQQLVLMEKGITSELIPAISFQIEPQDDVLEALMRPDDFTGLVITSQTTLDAIKKNLETLSDSLQIKLLKVWGEKRNFAVYETTRVYSEQYFGTTFLGQKAVSLSTLAEEISHDHEINIGKPYLYFCSILASPKFPDRMSELGLHMQSIVCYKTIAHPELLSNWQKYLLKLKGVPQYLLFYSPSGVRIVMNILKLNSYKNASSLRIIPMGTSTKDELQAFGLKDFVFPTQPFAKYLRLALEEEKSADCIA